MSGRPQCECGTCQNCKQREYRREYYRANKSKAAAYQREYNKTHKRKSPATRELEASRVKTATPSVHRLQRLPIGSRWEREFEKLVRGL